MLGGDGEGDGLPFAKLGRTALEHDGGHRPVAGAAEQDLARAAVEDDPFDGRGEAVGIDRNPGAERQRLGADRDRDRGRGREAWKGRPGDQAADRGVGPRPPGAARRRCRRRCRRPGPGEGSWDPAVEPRRRRSGGCKAPAARPPGGCGPGPSPPDRSARASASPTFEVRNKRRQAKLGAEAADLVPGFLTKPGLDACQRLVEDQHLRLGTIARASATRSDCAGVSVSGRESARLSIRSVVRTLLDPRADARWRRAPGV